MWRTGVGVLLLQFLQIFNGVVTSDSNQYDATVDLTSVRSEDNPHQLRLWITISAQKRFLEVSWKNAPAQKDDNIILTTQDPQSFQKVRLARNTPLARFHGAENAHVPIDGYTTTTTPVSVISDGNVHSALGNDNEGASQLNYWTSNNGNDIVAAVKPSVSSQWFTTGVLFDYALSRKVTAETTCYGYWASYINGTGAILAKTCLRAYPRWMQELRSAVSGFRMRDLFIPGSHDSGSYRPNFDPLIQETLVSKYALCQDDDIRGQLMHGVRYLDIRVGYYKNTPELFFINHGITRQRPLKEIIDQVKEFVLETNEIVIFGLKEFPIGFGRDLSVHRLLVNYLHREFNHLLVHPSATWSASLRDIWARHENVILAYDKGDVVREHPQILFGSVEQRWGNVQSWASLERYLRSINQFDVSRLGSRPVADMAELTPETFDIILDKYGGLRKMADKVNWRISQLYRDELGEHANIIAADFVRGTTLIETAIEWNKRKVVIF